MSCIFYRNKKKIEIKENVKTGLVMEIWAARNVCSAKRSGGIDYYTLTCDKMTLMYTLTCIIVLLKSVVEML